MVVGALVLSIVTSASASAAPAVSIVPSLSPNRLDARARLTLAIRYGAGELGVPAAVRESVVRLPAGMSLDVPNLQSCAAARLRTRGASGCPRRSRLGDGHALVEARVGSRTITEDVALRMFLGPPDNLNPTFDVLAQGSTPVEELLVLTGVARPAGAPYGEQLILSIPPIPSLSMAPDASIADFALTVGAGDKPRENDLARIHVPRRCPVGGFPFAVEATYADGSRGGAVARIPCPRSARASRTVSLNETGHLHLTSRHNFTLNEQGSASGTVKGTIYVHLTAVSSSRVTAEVNIYTRGGSLSGHGEGSFHRSATTAGFSGSISFGRGTGSYAHVHGTGLSFSGTIAESHHDAIVVHVSGRMSD